MTSLLLTQWPCGHHFVILPGHEGQGHISVSSVHPNCEPGVHLGCAPQIWLCLVHPVHTPRWKATQALRPKVLKHNDFGQLCAVLSELRAQRLHSSYCSAGLGLGRLVSDVTFFTVLGRAGDCATSQGWEMWLPTVSSATTHPYFANVNFSGV